MLSDTNNGDDASMMWYTMLKSAKLKEPNVYGYLLHLLTELPKIGENHSDEQIDSILP